MASNIQAGPFKPKSYSVNDKFYHLEAKFLGKVTATKLLKLGKQELKLIQAGYVANVCKSLAQQTLATIGKARIVVHEQDASAFTGSKKDAFVTVFTGKGRPTVDDAGSYIRANVSESERVNGLRFRWIKVEFEQELKPESVPTALSAQAKKFSDSDDYACFHISMGLDSTAFKLGDLVRETGDATDPARKTFNLATLNSLLAKGLTASPSSVDNKTMVLHGHKTYHSLCDKVTTIKGLDFTHGTARKLWFSGDQKDSLVLSEKPCSKFFFPPVTVAEFLDEYLSLTKTLCDIRDALVGVKVRIKTPSGHEDVSIKRLAELPATVDESAKHFVWTVKGKTLLKHPELPCVDVGTANRQELLPAEMCKILPLQSAGKNLPVAVQNALTPERYHAIDSPNAGRATEVFTALTKMKVGVDQGRMNFHAALGESVNVLFVEAGTGQKMPKGWPGLCQKVFSNANKDSELSLDVLHKQTLALKYTPGTDCANVWKQQLEAFKTKHASRDKTLIVVGNAMSEHTKAIYETLKTICDTKDIGKQTFFVNMATLVSKQRESSSDGVNKAANEISRRMRIHNPLPRSDSAATLAVGVHVTSFEAQKASIGVDGKLAVVKESRFLVSVASRKAQQAQGYKTTRHLLKAADMHNVNLATMVSAHLEDREPAHVMVFRSGYLASATSTVNATSGNGDRRMAQPESASLKTCHPKHLSMTSFEHDKTSGHYSARVEPVETEKAGLVGSISTSANVELKQLEDGLVGRGIAVSYILVDENDACEISPNASRTSQAAAAEEAQMVGSMMKDGTSFCKQPATSVGDAHTITAHREVSPKTVSKTVSLTLLGAKLTTPARDAEKVAKANGDRATAPTCRSSGQSEAPQTDEATDTTPRPTKTLSIQTDSNGTADKHAEQSSPTPSSNSSAKDSLSPTSASGKTDASAVTTKSTNTTDFATEGSEVKVNGDSGSETSSDHGDVVAVIDSPIETAELQVLADLFNDTHLELYSTKLPIPTYLAQAAAKRAMMHIKRSRVNNLAEVELPEVAAEVARSLYYL